MPLPARLGADRLEPLAPVPLETEIAVPVGSRTVVRVGVVRVRCRDVGARGRDERRLVHPVSHAVGPAPKRCAEGLEVALDVVEDTEMDDPQASRSISGGGVGANTNLPGAMRTPAASPL